ncbi:hypothetical protein PUNSTDRAFT_96027 [Punctularia strigosozonata HHB-11173 SS5]|uniref:uncharacterized protein n=1 Tax=Punctularia strigosozonata (strain HHB-11173) TaxID=741275 RepID=UPI0004417FEC|nr:uncharacterized protein PUNSTDRAFT_96027 [Punctularia strigosozonata HHB-11173 SS5]EIN14285.1 hypothetical protein PUNSTDRAFT_96027 [Punctularia strigosozonata HHB-11173 SS5]
MGQWTQYDEDDYRLPEGMKRVGYDADTQTYYYRDQSGTLYQGPEGAQYGELRPVSDAPAPLAGTLGEDLEAAPTQRDGFAPLPTDENSRHYRVSSPYRTLFPFFLIIATFLLLVWRIILVPSSNPPPPPCAQGTQAYYISNGDTCWKISRIHGIKVQDLLDANPTIECQRLSVGTRVCIPPKVANTVRRGSRVSPRRNR